MDFALSPSTARALLLGRTQVVTVAGLPLVVSGVQATLRTDAQVGLVLDVDRVLLTAAVDVGARWVDLDRHDGATMDDVPRLEIRALCLALARAWIEHRPEQLLAALERIPAAQSLAIELRAVMRVVSDLVAAATEEGDR